MAALVLYIHNNIDWKGCT